MSYLSTTRIESLEARSPHDIESACGLIDITMSQAIEMLDVIYEITETPTLKTDHLVAVARATQYLLRSAGEAMDMLERYVAAGEATKRAGEGEAMRRKLDGSENAA